MVKLSTVALVLPLVATVQIKHQFNKYNFEENFVDLDDNDNFD